MPVEYGGLPFAEQIKFFLQKLQIPTEAWTDVYADEHEAAFMVAGAAKASLLSDLHGAVEKAISGGGTLEQFRKDFDQIVSTHGWEYKGSRGWRTRVIYDTNLRQSYNAGREKQMADPALRKRRPYGLYRHGDSVHPRPVHLALDGTVLPLDDPFWAVYSPQNGWGCKCKKFMVGDRDLERMGLTVADKAPPVVWRDVVIGKNGPNPQTVSVPEGIDPGFEYRPGDAAKDRLKETILRQAANLPEEIAKALKADLEDGDGG